MLDRLKPLLVIIAMFVLLGIAMALVVGAPLASQTPTPTIRTDPVQTTSTGYAVQVSYTTPPRDSLVVVKVYDGRESGVARYAASAGSASYSRKVTMGASATGVYRFVARRYLAGKVDSASVSVQVGPVPTPVPTLAILVADTTVSTRTAGDTTFTTRQIVTTRGVVDTARTVTVTVAPPVVAVIRADSVRLYNWNPASYDTTTWVTGNFKVFPLTMPGWVNMRWLLNGTQAGTSIQVQHYSTARFPRPAAGTYQLVGCARVQGQLAATPEVCSPGYPLTIGRLATDTVATIPPPPAPDSSLRALGFGALGVGPMLTDSFIPAIWRAHGPDTLRFPVMLHWTPPAGMHAGVRVTFAERPDTVWRTVSPADSIPLPAALWSPATSVSALIPIRRPASGQTLTVSTLAYVVRDSTGSGYGLPTPLTVQYVEP